MFTECLLSAGSLDTSGNKKILFLWPDLTFKDNLEMDRTVQMGKMSSRGALELVQGYWGGRGEQGAEAGEDVGPSAAPRD